MVGWVGLLLAACDPPISMPLPTYPTGRTPSPSAAELFVPPTATRGARRWHVRPRALTTQADGSRERPFAELDRAYAQAQPGDVVVLRAGHHGSISAPPPGIEVRGDGPTQTYVQGPLLIDAGNVTVGDLTVVGGHPVVDLAGSDEAPIGLHRVIIIASRGTALRIDGRAMLEEVQIRFDPASIEPDHDPSRLAAVEIGPGAQVAWRQGSIIDSPGMGFHIQAARVELRQVEVHRAGSIGLYADRGVYTLHDVHISQCRAAGARFVDAVSTLRDVMVEDILYDPTRGTGSGIGIVGGETNMAWIRIVAASDRALRITRGATAHVGRLDLIDAGVDGLSVTDHSEAAISDARIYGAGNSGISVIQGRARIDRVEIGHVGRCGLFVSDGFADVTQLSVADSAGRGITLFRAQASLREVDVARAAAVGIQVTDPAGFIDLRHSRVRDCTSTGIAVWGAAPLPVRLVSVTVSGTRLGEDHFGPAIHGLDTALEIHGLDAHDNAGPDLVAEASTVRLHSAE